MFNHQWKLWESRKLQQEFAPELAMRSRSIDSLEAKAALLALM
ncbi:hypothetical protein QUB80_24645 [Chlorogloeopsis sp. ULAP01]|nr:hypothetical protein [Chlorogloeopsis sp. ULAP01]MDM9383879.1 hypothetical protein [Chlorogloeopsis sp. ULAP01]